VKESKSLFCHIPLGNIAKQRSGIQKWKRNIFENSLMDQGDRGWRFQNDLTSNTFIA